MLQAAQQRLGAQLLSGPPLHDVVAVVERLLAVQAQDPRGARLAVRARTSGLTAADVDAALNERSVVITWLNRGAAPGPWRGLLVAAGPDDAAAHRR